MLHARNIKLEAENTSLKNRVAEFEKLERQRLKNIGPTRINITYSPKTWAASTARLEKRISELEAENISLKNRTPIRVEEVDYAKLATASSALSKSTRGKAE